MSRVHNLRQRSPHHQAIDEKHSYIAIPFRKSALGVKDVLTSSITEKLPRFGAETCPMPTLKKFMQESESNIFNPEKFKLICLLVSPSSYATTWL